MTRHHVILAFILAATLSVIAFLSTAGGTGSAEATTTPVHQDTSSRLPDVPGPGDGIKDPSVVPEASGAERDGETLGEKTEETGEVFPVISADGFSFRQNRGEGLRRFEALGITQDALGDYDDPALLETIILDLTAGIDLRNEALNGLRRSGQPAHLALKRAIVLSDTFSDDYRAYAMQHLCLWCQTVPEGDGKRRRVLETIHAFAGKTYPIGVQREAMFGLAKIEQTRGIAVSLLEDRIEAGQERDFADLYVRVCQEEQLEPKATLRAKLGLEPVPTAPLDRSF